MIARVLTAALHSFYGDLVEVETDMKQGLPGIHIVGMGNKAVDEARERIRSAITHSLLQVPPQKFVINLAPAELPKDGAHFDLALAISLLVATKQLTQSEVAGALFAGELSLDGTLKPIRGAVSVAETARRHQTATVYLPAASAPQATLVDGVTIFGIDSLQQLFLHLKGIKPLAPLATQPLAIPARTATPLFDAVSGQAQAKRALQIAIAGRHNLLISGPPGAGKSMLAKAARELLPPLSQAEQRTVTHIHALAGITIDSVIVDRPFRSPHHHITTTALIGGGGRPKPGEISLSHHGILFLDELPEYSHVALESLRQPLEDHTVTIARLHGSLQYPARFILIATMNPCPCGFYGDAHTACRCTSYQRQRYLQRLSGPLLDRIDICVHVERVDTNMLMRTNMLNKKQRPLVLDSIAIATTAQEQRYKSSDEYNGYVTHPDLPHLLQTSPAAMEFLTQAANRLRLSARASVKTLRLARTIADLENAQTIEPQHISEALQLRVIPHES